jgi:hypothetical protein
LEIVTGSLLLFEIRRFTSVLPGPNLDGLLPNSYTLFGMLIVVPKLSRDPEI